jgi:DNA-binding CsgD family transcriptional regulator/tetratricopeptide (TPR) repeat protein
MPLGILLAAAWVQTLSLAEIGDEITRSLDFLHTRMRDIPERQRSLRAVFDQLWLRLSDDERRVFMRTSVFRGGCTREAFEAVTGGSLPLLAALVEKSLLRRDDDGRYRIHELLQQYAQERLRESPDDDQQTHQSHARWYAGFLADKQAGLEIGRPQTALAAIDAEIENVQAAWLTMAEARMAAEIRQSAACLWHYGIARYLTRETIELFQQAIHTLTADASPEAQFSRAVLQVRQGTFWGMRGQPEIGKDISEAGLVVLRAQGDKAQLITGLTNLVDILLDIHGWTQMPEGRAWDWTDGLAAAHEALALARELGDVNSVAHCLYLLSWIAFTRRRYDEAWELGHEALAAFRQVNNLWMVSAASGPLLGRIAEVVGRYDEACQLRHESLRLAESTGNMTGAGLEAVGLGYVAYLQGDYAEAHRWYVYSAEVLTAIPGSKRRYALSATLINVAKLWAAQDKTLPAVEMLAFIKATFSTREMQLWVVEPLAELEARLTEAGYAAAVARGQAMNLDTALQQFMDDAPPPTGETPTQPAPDALTEREREIIGLVAQGMSNREIATTLIFSVGTVKWYINQIFGKLHVSNRTRMVARARELNLIP